MAQEGFVWQNERPSENEDPSKEKWGWVGKELGSWAELEVDTTSDLGVSKLAA